MNEYQAGDIVKLRGGSPDMTVQHVFEDGSLLVVWLDEALHMNTYAAPAICFGLRRKADGTEFRQAMPVIKAAREAFSA